MTQPRPAYSVAQVVVVDSGGANLASLGYALERLGVTAIVTTDAAVISSADRVLLPGVGNAAAIMQRLEELALTQVIRALTSPVLGICLGMQLLFAHSAEGDTTGLGLLPGRIERMQPTAGRPVPHMGWNTLRQKLDDPLLQGLTNDDWFYFVHGYYAPPMASSVIATVEYGEEYAAVVRRNNFRGVQFHPERSGQSGARLLANFMRLPT
ncbi:MAG: imidazole glycerol phosphate synthase subunit HisH [Gammaproteobacteria bacterium]|nr:imidazole glycerol phosphate synthase subunit HisH [Gammaproteobacteria bacterium]